MGCGNSKSSDMVVGNGCSALYFRYRYLEMEKTKGSRSVDINLTIRNGKVKYRLENQFCGKVESGFSGESLDLEEKQKFKIIEYLRNQNLQSCKKDFNYVKNNSLGEQEYHLELDTSTGKVYLTIDDLDEKKLKKKMDSFLKFLMDKIKVLKIEEIEE